MLIGPYGFYATHMQLYNSVRDGENQLILTTITHAYSANVSRRCYASVTYIFFCNKGYHQILPAETKFLKMYIYINSNTFIYLHL